MRTALWWGNLLRNIHLEDREEDRGTIAVLKPRVVLVQC